MWNKSTVKEIVASTCKLHAAFVRGNMAKFWLQQPRGVLSKECFHGSSGLLCWLYCQTTPVPQAVCSVLSIIEEVICIMCTNNKLYSKGDCSLDLQATRGLCSRQAWPLFDTLHYSMHSYYLWLQCFHGIGSSGLLCWLYCQTTPVPRCMSAWCPTCNIPGLCWDATKL